jgi:hypothetical protein
MPRHYISSPGPGLDGLTRTMLTITSPLGWLADSAMSVTDACRTARMIAGTTPAGSTDLIAKSHLDDPYLHI